MFGYVKPLKCELKVKEWEYYKAAYCGLCHALKKRGGLAARFVVNYDFTFLAILLCTARGEASGFCYRRCVASPMRKKCACVTSRSFEEAADAAIILSWWKLKDTIQDSGFFEGIPARLGSLFLRRAYHKAYHRNPDFSELTRACLDQLHDLEKKRINSLDQPADTFARILQALTCELEKDTVRRPLEQMFYQIGRFIYLIDAWDDFARDLKEGGYNPIAERFDCREAPLPENIQNELVFTLNQSVNAALAALALVDTGPNRGLLENILALGLPHAMRLVSEGIKPEKENRIHERPV